VASKEIGLEVNTDKTEYIVKCCGKKAGKCHSLKVKVNCTLVQALGFCTGRTAHRGSRGIALLFHYHGTKRGCGVSVTPRPLFTSGKDPVPIVQETGWALGPVWTGAENLAPTGIRSPIQPVASRYTDWATRPTQSLKTGTNPFEGVATLTHYSGRVTQICVFNTVKLGTSASSP